MKITVNKDELKKALKRITRIIDKKASCYAAKCVYLDADGGRLHITAADGDQSATVVIPCEGKLKVLARANELLYGLERATVNTIELKVATERLFIGPGIYRISCNTFAEPFATRPKTKTWYTKDSLSPLALKAALQDTIPFITREFRPHLDGVWLTRDELMSSDGFRIARKKVIRTNTELELKIPKKTAKLLKRVIDKKMDLVRILQNDANKKRTVITAGDWTFEIFDNAFDAMPCFRSAWLETDVEFTTHGADLKKILGKVKRCEGYILEVLDDGNVHLIIDGNPHLIATNAPHVKALITKIDSKFLKDVIRSNGTITFGFRQGANSPLIVRHSNGTQIMTMPMNMR